MARSPAVRRIAIGAAIGVLVVAAIGPTDYRAAVASSVGGGALGCGGGTRTRPHPSIVRRRQLRERRHGHVRRVRVHGTSTPRRALPPASSQPAAVLEGLLHAVGFSQVALPDLPTSLSFGAPLTFSSAFALSLVVAALAGLLMHALVFRPLRHAPPLAKTVASVGLLLVLQSVVVLRFTSQAVAVKPLFEKRPVHAPRHVVRPRPADPRRHSSSRRPWSCGPCIASLASGWPTRAAAEDEKGAVLIGLSPERLATVNWMISAVLAAAVGILAATINASIDPTTITLLIVPALGAALVGGLTSFGVTVAAAFAIAGAQALLQFLAATDLVVSTGGWCADARAQGSTAVARHHRGALRARRPASRRAARALRDGFPLRRPPPPSPRRPRSARSSASPPCFSSGPRGGWPRSTRS